MDKDSPTPNPSPERDGSLRPTDPEWIDEFEILSRLGEGGMGTVYLAEASEATHQRVALKVIKRGMDTYQVLARFDAERNALNLMNHPNVARILGSGETESGLPYFVMEYVDGVPIDDYCRDNQVSLEQRLRLIQQVCEAVQHAHTKGIVHRDLKPSNILITLEDGRPVPKVIDFGLAKALNRTLTEMTLATTMRQFIGTFEYMSPEQARTRGIDVDTKTDVYAIGVILYELLVDKPPFDELWRHMDSEILEIIVDREPPRPSQRFRQLEEGSSRVLAEERGVDRRRFIASLQGELDWIVLKTLEKDRDRRYETPLALAEDLERHLSGEEPVQARPPSALYSSRKFARRYRGILTSTVLVLLSLLAGLSWALVERNRTEAENHRVLRLSDLRRLRQLRAESEDLFPASERRVPEFERWLERAHELHDRLPEHREVLTERVPLTDEELWEQELLTSLVAELERFGGPTGRITDVASRLQWAKAEDWETVRGPVASSAWDRAVGSISNPAECPLYAGLKIEARCGMVPLEQNEQSGLWEFWHPLSGERPVRNLDWDPGIPERSNYWRIEDATGMVFVLVPGGEFRMGAMAPAIGGSLAVFDGFLVVEEVDPGGLLDRAEVIAGDRILELNGVDLSNLPDLPVHLQRPLEEAIATLRTGTDAQWIVERDSIPQTQQARVEIGVGSPNVDPSVSGRAGPVQSVKLSPFFLSKYEMTKAQWARLPARLKRPSQMETGNEVGAGIVVTTIHPVESISWEMATELLGRCDLVLPTEAQWEYACRAGSTSIFWSGSRWQDLHGVANIADRHARRNRPRDPDPQELEDGYPVHSPVGRFLPNPFGLHDVHGNVAEWVRDSGFDYERALPGPGDGVRQTDELRTLRGGAFDHGAKKAGSAKRFFSEPDRRMGTSGLRPSLPLTHEDPQ